MMIKPFGAAISWLLTVGSSIVSVGKAGGTIEADGYANGDPTFGSFGSLSPSTWAGFTIMSLYNVGGTTYFVVSGDAHLSSPVVKVSGVNQNLSSGTYSGGKTSFSGTAPNPFTGPTQPVTIA